MNTVSLEVAKELFEIGYDKNTQFEYDLPGFQGADYYPDPRINYPIKQSYIRPKPVLRAPQIHEILDSLPYMISIGTKNVFFKMEIFEDDYRIGYYEFDQHPWGEQISENPHDAAAKLLIWCIKNNYVTL